jgi:lysozyme
METSKQGIEFIKKLEGFKPKPYLCDGGVLTIGYGHTRGVKFNDICNETQGEIYLREDLKEAETAVNKLEKEHPLTQNQYDALVAFCFNVGGYNFENSTLRRCIVNNDSEKNIRGEFGRWVYTTKKSKNKIEKIKNKGLQNRRKLEADLFFK